MSNTARQYLEGKISSGEYLGERLTSGDVGDFVPVLIDVTDKDVEEYFPDDVNMSMQSMNMTDVVNSDQEVVVIQ